MYSILHDPHTALHTAQTCAPSRVSTTNARSMPRPVLPAPQSPAASGVLWWRTKFSGGGGAGGADTHTVTTTVSTLPLVAVPRPLGMPAHAYMHAGPAAHRKRINTHAGHLLPGGHAVHVLLQALVALQCAHR